LGGEKEEHPKRKKGCSSQMSWERRSVIFGKHFKKNYISGTLRRIGVQRRQKNTILLGKGSKVRAFVRNSKEREKI